MNCTLKQTFWTDPKIERLPAELKLAALWMMSCPSRNNAGYIPHVSPLRFQLETGLQISSLEALCKELPSSFIALPDGGYFAVHFIRHSFSQGGRFSLGNKALCGVVRSVLTLPQTFQEVFFSTYPELKKHHAAAAAFTPPEPSPFQGACKGAEEEEEEEASSLDHRESDKIRKASEDATLRRQSYAEVRTRTEHPPAAAPTDVALQITIDKIFAAYPRRTHHTESYNHIYHAIKHGADPQEILAGTQRIAAVVATWTEAEKLKYIPTAPAFFAGGRWKDDPTYWKSRQTTNLTTPPDHNPLLGGRKIATTITVPTQPELIP